MAVSELNDNHVEILDPFDFLEAPESAPRYRQMRDWLTRCHSGTSFDLLDIGCGHGEMRQHLPEARPYVGIDESPRAIDRCRSRYPRDEFHCAELLDGVTLLGAARRRFDTVVLNGVIDPFGHRGHRDRRQTRSDHMMMACTLDRVVKPGGILALIICVPYSDHPDYGLFAQAAWTHEKLANAVRPLGLEPIGLTLAPLLGLEARIADQRLRPSWFIDRQDDKDPTRDTGHFMAALSAAYRAPAPAPALPPRRFR